MDSIKKGINSIPDIIVTGITDAIKEVFVPDPDYIATLFDLATMEFEYIKVFHGFVTHIKEYLLTHSFNEPPVIHMNLGEAESKYDWGGDAIVLDMSWYSRYKPTVDAFLSAWIYLFFGYQVFTRLPNIINGVAGDFKTTYVVADKYTQSQSAKRGRKGGK